ncbi:E1-E2 ATPase-domain-containing protein [Coprinopsis sp. MPI-PUGE-AT-0042]|nr:E1-E2 ATPase-domain-containing protein [Coprinopsis sp. MPI-PUGE-AT-0042]
MSPPSNVQMRISNEDPLGGLIRSPVVSPSGRLSIVSGSVAPTAEHFSPVLVLDVEPPVMGHGGRCSPRYCPLLLIANSAIGYYEERNTGNTVKALIDPLAPNGKAHRDNIWQEIESAILVPGDIIAFKIGDIVPADCRLTKAINVSIDQAALTGESLPINKKTREKCFFGFLPQSDLSALSPLVSLSLLKSSSSMPASTTSTSLDNILVYLIVGIPIAMPTVLFISLATRTENQDAINTCLVGALGDPAKARARITLLDFKPFKPINKCTEITCREDSTSKLKHVSKGMTSVIH